MMTRREVPPAALLAFILSLGIGLATAGPSLALSVSPGAVAAGGSHPMTIYTPGSDWSDGVAVSLGSGVAVTAPAILTPEVLRVQVEVDLGAEPGPRDVVVRQGEVEVIAAGAFHVVAAGVNGDPESPLAANVLQNPGFEAGNLGGWIPSTWTISNVMPHSGNFDAYDRGGSGGGGGCLRQNFAPVDSDNLTAFNFWLRQPDDAGIAQVIVFHQANGSSIGVAFTNDNDTWTFEDFTNLVIPNDFVTGIHVCGFGGGFPTPDDSWADDFLLDEAGVTAAEPSTWGRIKAALR